MVSHLFNFLAEDENAVLRVLSVNYNIITNTEHFTDLYKITKEHEIEGTHYEPKLVIRRGQSFDVTIQVDREYDPEKITLILCLTLVSAHFRYS